MKFTPEPGRELQIPVRHYRLRHPVKADDVSNVEPGEIRRRRLHRDWGEMGPVHESAYYDP